MDEMNNMNEVMCDFLRRVQSEVTKIVEYQEEQ